MLGYAITTNFMYTSNAQTLQHRRQPNQSGQFYVGDSHWLAEVDISPSYFCDRSCARDNALSTVLFFFHT